MNLAFISLKLLPTLAGDAGVKCAEFTAKCMARFVETGLGLIRYCSDLHVHRNKGGVNAAKISMLIMGLLSIAHVQSTWLPSLSELPCQYIRVKAIAARIIILNPVGSVISRLTEA